MKWVCERFFVHFVLFVDIVRKSINCRGCEIARTRGDCSEERKIATPPASVSGEKKQSQQKYKGLCTDRV